MVGSIEQPDRAGDLIPVGPEDVQEFARELTVGCHDVGGISHYLTPFSTITRVILMVSPFNFANAGIDPEIPSSNAFWVPL